jgi:paraquat-inducible protein B
MPDDSSIPPVRTAKAVPKRRAHFSVVWIIPLVAAAAGAWIVATKILSRGPEITITFSSAEGLEPNKTKVRFNGLEVGTLTGLRLAEDHQHVIATAQMISKSEAFLVKDTEFWVVKPRVSGLNITGLGTLLSGNYIGVQIGRSHAAARHFVALESPPLNGNAPGRLYTLQANELGSLGPGTPVYFRQIQAGHVVSYALDPAGHFLNVSIFVHEPYDKFVTPDTRFWHASGIDMSLTANGLHVQTESLMSVLSGGVAFEVPVDDAPQPPAAAGTVFTLFNNRSDALRPPPRSPQEYVLTFKQSVRGLQVGAPVELGGVTIGEVTAIRPQIDLDTLDFSVPVTVTVDPARYGVKYVNFPSGVDFAARQKQGMEILVAHGLRAQLRKASLISSALYVAIDMFPEAPPASLDWSKNPVPLPTISGNTEEIEGNVNKMLKSLDVTLAEMRGTLTNADHLLHNANTLVEPDSELNTKLINLLEQGGDAARALRILADYLERHPEALIHGKPAGANP